MDKKYNGSHGLPTDSEISSLTTNDEICALLVFLKDMLFKNSGNPEVFADTVSKFSILCSGEKNMIVENELHESISEGGIIEQVLRFLRENSLPELSANCFNFISLILFRFPKLFAEDSVYAEGLYEVLSIIMLEKDYIKTVPKELNKFTLYMKRLIERLFHINPIKTINVFHSIYQRLCKSGDREMQRCFLELVFRSMPVFYLVCEKSKGPCDEKLVVPKLSGEFDSNYGPKLVEQKADCVSRDNPTCLNYTHCKNTAFIGEFCLHCAENPEFRSEMELKAELSMERSAVYFYKLQLGERADRDNEMKFKCHRLELEVERVNAELEQRNLENSKMRKTLEDLETKNGQFNLKMVELREELFLAKESSASFENQTTRLKDELNHEKKKAANLSIENARIKAKIFECSEIRNKLTRKVDSQALIERQLQTLNKELFLMSEIHQKCEEKISKLQIDQRSSNEDQLTINNYRRQLAELRQKNRKLELKLGLMEEKQKNKEQDALEISECKDEKLKLMEEKYSGLLKETKGFQQELNRVRKELIEKSADVDLAKTELELLKTQETKNTREKCVGTQ